MTFRINGVGYDAPEVAIGSAPYTPAPPVGGVYTVTIGTVDADTSVGITVALRQLEVSVTAGDNVSLQPLASSTVAYGDSCEVRFTLSEGYNPAVAIGGVAQPAPIADGSGVYTVTVRNVTDPVSVSVTAVIQQIDVTLTRGENIILGTGTTAGKKQVGYGSDFPFSFRVAEGYLPELKVNNVEVQPGAPDATGLYRDTAYHITAATAIAITAKPDDGGGSTAVAALAADAPRFFPNPASDVLTFANTEKVSIYTVSGTLVGVYTEASVSIAHLPAGVYMVKMQRGSYTRTAQLVKH